MVQERQSVPVYCHCTGKSEATTDPEEGVEREMSPSPHIQLERAGEDTGA
ncbi:MAG: hypothetical protein WCJ39_02560 [bacterium]